MLCANLSVLYTVHYSGNWAYDSDSSIVTLMLLMCMVMGVNPLVPKLFC